LFWHTVLDYEIIQKPGKKQIHGAQKKRDSQRNADDKQRVFDNFFFRRPSDFFKLQLDFPQKIENFVHFRVF